VPPSSPIATVVEMAMKLYLTLSAKTAGVEHRASSAAFHTNYISAPSLWFYSRSDPVALVEDCETVIRKWQAQGTQVKSVVWDDTPHIQHARVDPARYFGALDTFIRENEQEQEQEQEQGQGQEEHDRCEVRQRVESGRLRC
jgi:alpha-beta hydrolase superfamily lysophospholipase